MYDVLCAGLTDCDLIFSELSEFPELGKEVASKDFIIKPGGAANLPVALTKLGLKIMFSTTLGKDNLGKIVYEYLEETGMDMSAVQASDKFRTSVSAVLSVGYERGFASYFAKNDKKFIKEQIEKFAPNCNHIHAYIEDCLRIPIIEIAQKYNKTISVDTSWNENIKLVDIKDILRKSNIFFTNEMEACSITETKNVEDALEKLSGYANFVVIKLGSSGSIIKKDNKIIRVPEVKNIKVVDTTGAGDLFCAGFIYGMSKGWDIEKTAYFASASGGLAVTFYGGMDETYTINNVNDYYRKIK